MDAAVLRLLLTPTGEDLEWGDLLATYSPWSGDTHVRLPDGSRLVCLTRLVPLFEVGGEVAAMVEVYRGHPGRDAHTADHFVYSLDAVDEGSSGDDPALRVQQELG